MKLNSKYRFVFFGFLFALFSVSCEELPCDYTNGIQVYAGFYQSTGDAISDTLIGTFSLTLLTEPDNPYIEEYIVSTNNFYFPLSMNEDTSTVILTFDDLVSDTLTFIYERTLALKSHPCGFDTFFEINEIINTNNRLDSVWVKKDIVDYDEEENIKIYF